MTNDDLSQGKFATQIETLHKEIPFQITQKLESYYRYTFSEVHFKLQKQFYLDYRKYMAF